MHVFGRDANRVRHETARRGPVETGVRPPRVLFAFAVYTALAVLIAGIAVVVFVRKNVTSNSRDKVTARTELLASAIVTTQMTRGDFLGPIKDRRLRHVDAVMKRLVLKDGVERVKIYNDKGVVVYSNDLGLIGSRIDDSGELRRVLSGVTQIGESKLNHEGGSGKDIKVFESYAPVRFSPDKPAVGVFELYVNYNIAAGSVRSEAVPMTLALLLVMLGLFLTQLPVLRRTTRALSFGNRELRRRAVDLQVNLVQRAEIEDRLRQTIKELERSEKLLIVSQEETIMRLSMAVESRDAETGRHIERMGRYCSLVASKLGWDRGKCDLLRIASPLHDVGKIAIPDNILQKPGSLTTDERSEMEKHAVIGHRVLADSDSELLDLAARIALTHHERWDGTGYPNGLAREDIPIEGRIAAVADVFDALTSDRVYREAMPVQTALSIMTDGRGTHFDPRILDVFFASMNEVLAIRDGRAYEMENAGSDAQDRRARRRKGARPFRASMMPSTPNDADDIGESRQSVVG